MTLRYPLLSALLFFTVSSLAFAGTSNCDLEVADGVSVVLNHDFNGDGKISVRESLDAFPHFAEKIRNLSQIESKVIGKSVFTYVLKFQKLPDPFPLLLWGSERFSWKYELDESQVEKALRLLSGCQQEE